MPLLFWLLTGTGAVLVTIGYVLIFISIHAPRAESDGVLAIIYMTLFALQNC